ncbi:hypothetical protein BgiBS90_013237, partial [Biomphalaria glabrata]
MSMTTWILFALLLFLVCQKTVWACHASSVTIRCTVDMFQNSTFDELSTLKLIFNRNSSRATIASLKGTLEFVADISAEYISGISVHTQLKSLNGIYLYVGNNSEEILNDFECEMKIYKNIKEKHTITEKPVVQKK